MELVTTADGSHTLYSTRYRQTYYSRHSALTESRHVFVDATGLAERLCRGQRLGILEVGFGSGLNFLLAADLALSAGASLEYTALEHTLIDTSILAQLNHAELIGVPRFWRELLNYLRRFQIDAIPSDEPFHYQTIELTILATPAGLADQGGQVVDVVFLDAFSPDENPELWSPEFLHLMHEKMAVGGVMSTYCAKGVVRRRLQDIGFLVERLPGPPGKREMLLATRQS